VRRAPPSPSLSPSCEILIEVPMYEYVTTPLLLLLLLLRVEV